MQLVAQVEQLKRQRRKARDRRKRTRVAGPRDPGPLSDFFTRVSPDLMPPRWLSPVVREMERIRTESIRLCFSVPPRHGKSTLAQHLIAWLLVLDPAMKILYVSYAQTFAEENIEAAKRISVTAGVTLGRKQTEKKWTTHAGGSVTASGMDGQLTGRGFHVVICDDPHKNFGEAHSRTIREGVVRGFRNDVLSRKMPKASGHETSFVIVHTRWHPEDLAGVMSNPTAPRPWQLINLPAVQPDGSPLAPELWSIADIERDRADLGEFDFAALHMGAPRPRGGLLFGDCDTTPNLRIAGRFRYAIGLDIAHSARTRSDYNAACVMRMDLESGTFDVVEVLREQGTLTDRVTGRGDDPILSDGFLRSLHSLTQRYPAAPVVMYAAKDETLIISLAARHDKYPVRIRARIAERDKWTRAQPYAAAWNDPGGKLRVWSGMRLFDEFVREHVNFTGSKGERDDMVDAGAAAYDELARSSGGGGPRGRARGTGEGSTAGRYGGVAA